MKLIQLRSLLDNCEQQAKKRWRIGSALGSKHGGGCGMLDDKQKKRVDLYLPFSNLTKPIKLIKPKLMK